MRLFSIDKVFDHIADIKRANKKKNKKKTSAWRIRSLAKYQMNNNKQKKKKKIKNKNTKRNRKKHILLQKYI